MFCLKPPLSCTPETRVVKAVMAGDGDVKGTVDAFLVMVELKYDSHLTNTQCIFPLRQVASLSTVNCDGRIQA